MTKSEARQPPAHALNSRIENFRNLSVTERLEQLVTVAGLSPQDGVLLLRPGACLLYTSRCV